MELNQFVGLAGAPLVQALVELVKRTAPSLKSRWYPALSVLFGVVLNLALASILVTDLKAASFIGVLTGLLSSGLFAAGKVGEDTGPATMVIRQILPDPPLVVPASSVGGNIVEPTPIQEK